MNIKRIIYFVLTVLMMIIIFGFSSQNSEDSNNLSYHIDIKIYDLIKSVQTSNKAENTTAASVDSKTEMVVNQVSQATTENIESKKNTVDYPLKDKLFKTIDEVVRKTAHVTLYALFAVFLALFIRTFGVKSWKTILLVLIIGFLYACLDEYNQKIGGTRTGIFKDCLIDSGGCLIGVILVVAIQSLAFKIKTRKVNQNERNKVKGNK